MDSSTESCVPPGFRFHPTDEELVGYYLRKKVASQKIDLDVIRDIDLYRIEPWDLQDRCRIGYEEQTEWYFFSHKDKKYPTGTRTNRATMAGFWKATGRDKAIHDKNRLIGMRKTLVFYKGRAPNGQKTDWIMHEYRLESEENAPPQEEGWVVCRAFKKRTNVQPRAVEVWDSSYAYEESNSRLNSIIDPIEYLQRPPPPPHAYNLQQQICKQETELDTLKLLQYSNLFVQLPQLESPSLPLAKHSISLPMMNISPLDNEEEVCINNMNAAEKVTDWRALDKFVASQLSPDDRFNSVHVDNKNCDMAALLMLQESLEEEEEEESNKLNGLLSSSGPGECDVGILHI